MRSVRFLVNVEDESGRPCGRDYVVADTLELPRRVDMSHRVFREFRREHAREPGVDSRERDPVVEPIRPIDPDIRHRGR